MYSLWIYQRERKSVLSVVKRPLFIIGNHKTGSTAIAMLLAKISGSTLANGLVNQMISPAYPSVLSGKMSFPDFMQANKTDFSQAIIKENLLTFFVDNIRRTIPDVRFLYIVRDPRDNIRSILNRVQIPGNLENFDVLSAKLSPTQRLVLDNSWLGITDQNYIDSLARRWVKAADIYLKSPNEMNFVRYEDFLQDKVSTITALATRMELPVINDISELVDIQYQPKGDHSVSWEDFFGVEHLARIEEICGPVMARMGYVPSRVDS